MNDERFQLLLEAFIDRSLSESEAKELLDAFAAEAEWKRRFIEDLRVSNLIHGYAIHQSNRIDQDVTESIELGQDSPDFSEAVLAELRPKSNVILFPTRRVAIAAAAAAAAVAILIGIGSLNVIPPISGLATLAHAIDSDWADGQYENGQRIGRGIIRLESGVASLDFAKGVRVTLEGPAKYELIGPGETRLHSGSLTAHVPPEGIGFQVHTEKVEVTDLGTTFGVSVGKDGETDVDVFEGEVEVKSVASREEKIIHEGRSLSMRDKADPLTLKRLEPRDFKPGWKELFGVMNTGGRIRFINAQLVKDPTLVVDEENIIVFPERFDLAPDKVVEVTLVKPGTYTHQKHLNASKRLFLKRDRKVNTYLIQYNPPHVEGIPNSEQIAFEGHVTFDRPILGIITKPEQLKATDYDLGKPRFNYPDHGRRGLEHGDTITLSEDRHTLSINWLVMQAIPRSHDQIRVIVDAAPES